MDTEDGAEEVPHNLDIVQCIRGRNRDGKEYYFQTMERDTIECPAATSPSCPQHRDRPGRKSSLYGNFMISREHYEYDASSVGIDPEPRCPGKVIRDSFLPHNSSTPRRRRRQIVVGDGAGAAPTNSDPNSRQTRAKTDPVGPRWRPENPLLGSAPAGQSKYRHVP